jgi:hypothetical protein
VVSERSFRAMWNSPSMKFMHDAFYDYMKRIMETVPEKPAAAAR